jgi:hypothetical protein
MLAAEIVRKLPDQDFLDLNLRVPPVDHGDPACAVPVGRVDEIEHSPLIHTGAYLVLDRNDIDRVPFVHDEGDRFGYATPIDSARDWNADAPDRLTVPWACLNMVSACVWTEIVCPLTNCDSSAAIHDPKAHLHSQQEVSEAPMLRDQYGWPAALFASTVGKLDNAADLAENPGNAPTTQIPVDRIPKDVTLQMGPGSKYLEVVDSQSKVIGGVAPIAGGASGAFADSTKLLDHYSRLGADFGATSAAQYEGMADAFLNGPRGTGVLQRVRANGDVARYDPASEAFGIVKPDGTIRTFYKPDPAVHGYPTNLDYFNVQ